MRRAAQITVIGAGVAGLSVALALSRHGFAVQVLEQAEAISEIGAGLQISPNGAVVLQALGLGADLLRIGQPAAAVELRDGLTGARVLRLGLGQGRGAGYHFVHRADLIGLLETAVRAAGAEIVLNQRIAGVTLGPGAPVWHGARGASGSADLLIGADGLNSALRQALNGVEAPYFTGQVAWRALIPERPGAPAVAEVHMGPGRHLVSYPLRGGTLRNVVAVEERAVWAAESWTTQDDPAALRRGFAAFSPRVQGWLGEVGTLHIRGLFLHKVASCWHGQGAVILGDAAHPMLPFLAQGANIALEDAWVLAAALAAQPDPALACAAYRSARKARVERVVAAAAANARAYHLRGPLKTAAHLALRIGGTLAPSLPLRRFGWLYDADVTRTL